ncbi:MAG: prolyl oligopeptidase family serine peptidase [Kiritimatiellaeota bacterium]|nr:prolyl oligopeptidase family serine peptidase [Kiritimatiellota bacterium]
MNLRGVAMAAATVALAAGCATAGGKVETRPGQHAETFSANIKLKTKIELKYLLYLPEDYAQSKKKWPLILFLHGAGERGDDVQVVAKHGPPKLVAAGKQLPFIIVSPQCPQRDWWSNDLQIAALDGLLKEIVSNYRVDTDRLYLTGLSMGGFGSWKLATEYPTRFAAVAPICGKGDPTKAKLIKDLPIWVFHGAKDPVVPIANSKDMVDALKQCGSDVKFTIYPDAQHDSWTETYNNPELYTWFLQHKRGEKK